MSETFFSVVMKILVVDGGSTDKRYCSQVWSSDEEFKHRGGLCC